MEVLAGSGTEPGWGRFYRECRQSTLVALVVVQEAVVEHQSRAGTTCEAQARKCVNV
jgi:hypothetical protein